MPGDEIDAGDGVTIEAEYISGNGTSTAMVIDGHGGTMVSGSRYFVDFASTNNLRAYSYPSNPFANTGKTFLGYNTAADGSGTMYQPGERLAATELVQKYYAQWKTEGSGSTGGGGGGGGGASVPADSGNTVSAPSVSNGKVSLDKATAKKGDTVTVTVTPDAGCKLDKLTVTDTKGNVLTVTNKGDGRFTFVMPDGKVTVTPTFVPAQTTAGSAFSDVAPGEWYADAVKYVTEKGLMNGTGGDKFSPDSSTTRAMLMTVLARYAGEDTAGGDPWYEKSMNWAKANGVSDGTNPGMNITREQLVTMLYRYAGSPSTDGSLTTFADSASVSPYAVTAMQWAVASGIVNGSNGRLNPQSNATRAEVAAILMRFCELTKI